MKHFNELKEKLEELPKVIKEFIKKLDKKLDKVLEQVKNRKNPKNKQPRGIIFQSNVSRKNKKNIQNIRRSTKQNQIRQFNMDRKKCDRISSKK